MRTFRAASTLGLLALWSCTASTPTAESPGQPQPRAVLAGATSAAEALPHIPMEVLRDANADAPTDPVTPKVKWVDGPRLQFTAQRSDGKQVVYHTESASGGISLAPGALEGQEIQTYRLFQFHVVDHKLYANHAGSALDELHVVHVMLDGKPVDVLACFPDSVFDLRQNLSDTNGFVAMVLETRSPTSNVDRSQQGGGTKRVWQAKVENILRCLQVGGTPVPPNPPPPGGAHLRR